MAAAAKQKDPRKVAAGRAGAATRKAKQELLEDELRKATYRQVGDENTTTKTPESTKTTPESTTTETQYSGGSAKVWAIGLAAVLGLAYFTASNRAPVKPPAPPPAAPTPETPKPVKQLKVTHDPFHME